MTPARGTRGMTLPELLVALVIVGVVGVAIVRLLVVQNRFFDHQLGLRGARAVSRGAVNLLLSDLRMVDASGAAGDTLGVVAAAPRSLTLRVPYAMGVLCNNSPVATVLLVPLDTIAFNDAAFSGYAWRDTVVGKYHYVELGTLLSPASPFGCATGFTPIAGARFASLVPFPLPGVTSGGLALGAPVLLYQTIRYDLEPSVTFPGSVGLWRTLLASNRREEIATPFDSAAVFQFFVRNADTSQAAPPAQLSDLRGIDVLITALSARAAQGKTEPDKARVTTAVFFKNRLN